MRSRSLLASLTVLLVVLVLLTVYGCGDRSGLPPDNASRYTVGDLEFTVRYSPEATFPTGVDDDGEATVEHGFWIGETVVTYELWYAVRTWAEGNGYRFANRGQEGSHGDRGQEPSEAGTQPVTVMTWYDAVVWCNALSEYLQYTPVYTYLGEPYMDSTNRAAGDYLIAQKVVGFRLPTTHEWELAARYLGPDGSGGAIEYPEGSGTYWSPGNFASGARGPYTDEAATSEAAWYDENSAGDDGRRITRPVGQKPAGGNALGLYDMSGNVFEWMHFPRGEDPVVRGGCYSRSAENLLVGIENPRGVPSVRNTYTNIGFRVVLSLEEGPFDTDGMGEDVDILYPVGSLVEVEWHGEWHNARIVEFDRGLYYITYDGYHSSWDEWVPVVRVRERTTEPVIVSVEDRLIVADRGTVVDDLDLPAVVEAALEDGTTIPVGVEWDTSAYDGNEFGEYVIAGNLIDLPEGLVNPDGVEAALTVRVTDAGAFFSRLRTGGWTGIDGLLFYIESDDGAHGYYYGTESPRDLTHVVVEDQRGRFVSMIVYDSDMYPIQWVFPDLTIQVLMPRDEDFNPGEATHIFVDEEQDDFVLDITLDAKVGSVLDRMPETIGPETSAYAAEIRDTLGEVGVLEMSVLDLAAIAHTDDEIAFSALLSVVATGIRIIDQLTALSETESSSVDGVAPLFSTLVQTGASSTLSPMSANGDRVRAKVAERILKRFNAPLPGTVVQMGSYLYRLASGHYDGHDIDGPAVSMLLCKGASSVPQFCNEFVFPNTPGNATRCANLCFATLDCFTDICQPMVFSVGDALNMRKP